MLLHTWLPATLKAAGIKVMLKPLAGLAGHMDHCQTRIKVVWHHDASPPGDSPGALNWMISNTMRPGANIWVDRYGTWHLVGTECFLARR